MSSPSVDVVVPGDVAAPTGGNVWDRRVRDELAAAGVAVGWHPVDGAWPLPAARERSSLERLLGSLPAGSAVLVDGLVACGVPEVVLAHAGRLRLGVVVHLPLAMETGLDPAAAARLDEAEREVLRAAAVVLVTSRWTAARLAGHGLRRTPVVALPGTDAAALHPPGTPTGSHLLCLGSLSPRKGQRVLLEALAGLDDRPGRGDGCTDWSARFVGSQPDALEAATVQRERDAAGLAGRVSLPGPLVGDALEEQWRWADLLVVPSHAETFGMVVTEALARGRPVVATTGSGLPEALGSTPDGPPGLLVPPGDPLALRRALRRWLGEKDLRGELVGRTTSRAAELTGWDRTARTVAAAFR